MNYHLRWSLLWAGLLGAAILATILALIARSVGALAMDAVSIGVAQWFLRANLKRFTVAP